MQVSGLVNIVKFNKTLLAEKISKLHNLKKTKLNTINATTSKKNVFLNGCCEETVVLSAPVAETLAGKVSLSFLNWRTFQLGRSCPSSRATLPSQIRTFRGERDQLGRQCCVGSC